MFFDKIIVDEMHNYVITIIIIQYKIHSVNVSAGIHIIAAIICNIQST